MKEVVVDFGWISVMENCENNAHRAFPEFQQEFVQVEIFLYLSKIPPYFRV